MISFTVLGVPVPQGSMVANYIPKLRRAIMHASNDSKLKKWRKQIAQAAALELRGDSPAGKKIALRVTALFVFEQAESNKDLDCVKKPDLDKLVRAVLDGITGVLCEDDAQVTEIHASKEYGKDPRCEVRVEEVGLVPVLIKPGVVDFDDIPF